VARDGTTKDGGLNRQMGERFVKEISALDKPLIAETGTGLTFRKGLDLPYLPDWRMEPFITLEHRHCLTDGCQARGRFGTALGRRG